MMPDMVVAAIPTFERSGPRGTARQQTDTLVSDVDPFLALWPVRDRFGRRVAEEGSAGSDPSRSFT